MLPAIIEMCKRKIVIADKVCLKRPTLALAADQATSVSISLCFTSQSFLLQNAWLELLALVQRSQKVEADPRNTMLNHRLVSFQEKCYM